jgi:predicted dehydrogenase
MEKVRWGVISTARIGTERVIPAMQAGQYCEIVAIASRSLESAQAAATRLGIPKAYGSYEELLADPGIDAIYNPLPNHLHVPWSVRALEAGKHVLCEKPLAMTAAEAEQLLDAANQRPQLKVTEAFMYRHHPQWGCVRQLLDEGAVGELRTAQSFFTYYNVDANNIRNIAAVGGGALMDIGCYCISGTRFVFGSEPQRVLGIVEYDPEFETDRLSSAVLDFGSGTATFTCATQLAGYQRVTVLGTEGRLEVETPYTPARDHACRIWHQRGQNTDELVIDPVDQYTLQGDNFSRAVLDDTPVPTPLVDAVNNMKVIDAVFRSAERGVWVEV